MTDYTNITFDTTLGGAIKNITDPKMREGIIAYWDGLKPIITLEKEEKKND